MAIPLPSEPEEAEGQRIISPFAQTTSTVQPPTQGPSKKWLLWILVAVVSLVALGTAGYFVQAYVNDPYRTMEPFPVDKFFSDYHSLTGSKFKGEVKVANDLGRTTEVGRLMVFTIGNDSRPVVVLIPPKLSGIYFTKGQNYRTSLEVDDGGLVYADTCEKD